jgi:hypothetical protein
MEIFINEKSLSGQYQDHTLTEGVNTFISAINTINNCKADKNIFTTEYFFNIEAIKGTHLNSILTDNKSLKDSFLLNIKNAQKWQNSQIHLATDSYVHNKIDYVSSSIAELAERKLRNTTMKGMLLNFTESIFGTLLFIDVLKNKTPTVRLDCSFDEDSVTKWLIREKFINPAAAYEATSKFPPKDYQTVLNNTAMFSLTTFVNQGRKVYSRIGTDELWVVDNQHYGASAHIEVFDSSTALHLGTSSINQVLLEAKYKVKKRKINLN